MLSFAGAKLWFELDPDLKSWLAGCPLKKHFKRKFLKKYDLKSADQIVPFFARSMLLWCL